MSKATLRVKLLREEAKLPIHATSSSAGYDLYSAEDFIVPSMGQALVDTGIAMEIPEGMCGMITSRSGLAVKHSIEKGAGLIDSDYRGPIKVLLHNHGSNTFAGKVGDRIAQIVIIPIFTPIMVLAKELSDPESKHDGFGSTGKS